MWDSMAKKLRKVVFVSRKINPSLEVRLRIARELYEKAKELHIVREGAPDEIRGPRFTVEFSDNQAESFSVFFGFMVEKNGSWEDEILHHPV